MGLTHSGTLGHWLVNEIIQLLRYQNQVYEKRFYYITLIVNKKVNAYIVNLFDENNEKTNMKTGFNDSWRKSINI